VLPTPRTKTTTRGQQNCVRFCVQVRQHGGVEVDGQRERVGRVVEQHDDVRDPAADERDEDDEHRLHLTNCLHRSRVTRSSGQLTQNTNNAQLGD